MTKLPLSQIRTDGGTQPRLALDFNIVNQYMDDMLRGDVFPAVSVFYDGTEYWLADGFHRHQAAWQGELAEISAKVHQGSREDAIWFSFAVNREHGLRRSDADLKRIIEAALAHPKSSGLSDNAIAKHVGCSQQYVSKLHRESQPHLTTSCKIDSRTVTRNGTTYQQNVSNIGKRVDMTPTAPPEPVPEPAPHAPVAQPEVQPARNGKVAGSTTAGASKLHAVEKPSVEVDPQSESISLLNAIFALSEHKINSIEFVSTVPAEHRKRLYENAIRATEFMSFACEQLVKKGVA